MDLPALLTPSAEAQMVQSLGFAVYRALDWGLDENEERELSPRLEQLIDLMTNSDSEDSGCATADEGYGGQDEEEEGGEGPPRSVRTFGQAMRCCVWPYSLSQTAVLAGNQELGCTSVPHGTVLAGPSLLQKLKEDEEEEERPVAELGNLRNTDWARLWVQLMRELRHGVKLKKVQEKQFNPLPTEYQLTPFEMLMQDIRARNYKLRKVMVDGDIPPRVKKDAHELILDFIRSRPPLKQVSASTRPPPCHESVGEARGWIQCCPCQQLQAPLAGGFWGHHLGTLGLGTPDKHDCGHMAAWYEDTWWLRDPCDRDSAYARDALPMFEGSALAQECSGPCPVPQSTVPSHSVPQEFSHPVESLALTVEEMINVRRVLVKAEMEKFLQSKELYSSLRRGKVCCCCRAKFPLFSWPTSCFFCKRSVCSSCSLKMKMPSKKLAHIPVYALGFESLPGSLLSKAPPLRRREPFHSLSGPCWRRVEEEFPHIYAQGSVLRDVCSDCAGFVTDVVSSSRRSVAVLNASAASRRHAKARSLYSDAWLK
ncbi:hypothetical protein IHE44_0002517 [Lamprotornis superbus]|uniref:KIND domain-containing protein n=1 Tax=Lamprotornis superbus TaxID=245042 RepID=A0A835NKJ4_9PASS|nr:hypothetical protein IHE44_0002517 [Lamprotornis superbus]